MKIELVGYAIENEDGPGIFATLSIRADGIGPFDWHIIPDEWDEAGGWVMCGSRIGMPGDEIDLSSLSPEDRSLLLGERYEDEDVFDLESAVNDALKIEMKAIARELGALHLRNLAQKERYV